MYCPHCRGLVDISEFCTEWFVLDLGGKVGKVFGLIYASTLHSMATIFPIGIAYEYFDVEFGTWCLWCWLAVALSILGVGLYFNIIPSLRRSRDRQYMNELVRRGYIKRDRAEELLSP